MRKTYNRVHVKMSLELDLYIIINIGYRENKKNFICQY